MDRHQFDALARALGTARSRRGALGLLAGAAVVLGAAAEEGAARRKGKGKGHAKSGHPDGKGGGNGGAQPAGKKKKKCKGGTTRCGKKCHDLTTDPAHCGACTTVCAAGQACQNGTCGCGSTSCGSGCCDGATCKPGTAADACGSGGGACAACPTGGTCADGACACPNGQSACSGACVNRQIDPANCGDCGHACATGEACCGGACTALNTVLNCGECGHVCPGVGQPNANVACQNGGTCTFSCQGDTYDVDGNMGNGCEQALTDAANHTSETAKFATPATQGCSDELIGGFSGTIASDARVHANPAVPAFDAATGSAPQFWKVNASGGACSDGLDVSITMTGATDNCYKLTVTTDKASYAAVVVNGAARINPGDAGIYSGGTTIFFKIEKTCGTSVREVATYAVSYHL